MYIVHNVYFLGGAVSIHSYEEWSEILRVVRGTIYNGYSKNDYILHLYRASMFQIPIGRIPLFEVEKSNKKKMSKKETKLQEELDKNKQELRVSNVDLTDVAGGHISYRAKLNEVLDAIDFNA